MAAEQKQVSMSDAMNALGQVGQLARALAQAEIVLTAADSAEQLERECLARIKTYPDAEKQSKKQYEETEARIKSELAALKQSKVEAQARLTAVDAALAERTEKLNGDIAELTQQRDTLAAAVATLKAAVASV